MRCGRQGSHPTPPAVSTLEKTLPQLLAKLSRLENRGVHNASLALSDNIGRVRKLIAEARSAANKVCSHLRDISSDSGPGKLSSKRSCAALLGQGVDEVQWAFRGTTAHPTRPC